MDRSTRETGRMTRQMEREFYITQTGMCMMASGEMTKLMAKGHTHMPMEQLIKGTGLMTSKMDMGLKPGLMELDMKECIKKERNMEKENLTLQTGVCTMENSKTTKSAGEESTDGTTAKSLKASGLKTKCTGTEGCHGLTESSMRVSSKTTKDTDLALSSGKTERFTKVLGIKENSMEKALSSE